MRKKIIIIGGGFAGIQVAKKLYKNPSIQLIIVDQKDESTFLPLLPDVLSGKISASHVTYSLSAWCKKRKIQCYCETVTNILSAKNTIQTNKQELTYDYLVITTGSETNFYNNSLIQKKSYKIDGLEDILNLQKKALSKEVEQIIISGGGYTGIETASHLRRLFANNGLEKTITIIEFSDQLLGSMPLWLKNYVIKNLYELNINYLLKSQVTKVESNVITINDKDSFTNAMLVWASGVKATSLIDKLEGQKDRQGRILVKDTLNYNNNVFICGDACQFIYKGKPLRMSVRFAVDAANIVAENISRSIEKNKLKKFIPHDPGYIVPMSNNKSVGIAKGIRVKGKLATFLHYTVSFWFSDKSNKLGLLKDLILH